MRNKEARTRVGEAPGSGYDKGYRVETCKDGIRSRVIECPHFNIEEEMARHMGTRKNGGHDRTGDAKRDGQQTRQKSACETKTSQHTQLFFLFSFCLDF